MSGTAGQSAVFNGLKEIIFSFFLCFEFAKLQ